MIGRHSSGICARKGAPVLVILACIALLSACSEINQTAKTEKVYAGRKDTKAYDSANFAGDKGKWETALVARSKTQNEYNRTDVAGKPFAAMTKTDSTKDTKPDAKPDAKTDADASAASAVKPESKSPAAN